jgi:hypothetical protein
MCKHCPFALPNLFLAWTNVVGILPALVFADKGYMPQAVTLLLVVLASTWYHLIEHHKLGMPGVKGNCCGCWIWLRSMQAHVIFINIDRLASILSIIICTAPVLWNLRDLTLWVALLYYLLPLFWPWAPIGFLALAISDHVSPRTSRPILVHVLSHSVWHLASFSQALVFANWL